MKLEDILDIAGENIRITPGGKYSIDDVMKYAMNDASRAHRCNTYRRVREQFDLQAADRASFPGSGPTTPVASADEIERLLTLLSAIRRPIGRPCSQRVARLRSTPDDSLYVMRYSHDPQYVKIGRSRNVEGRRAQLEAGQNLRVQVLVIFPGLGHFESRVHAHLDGCRSNQGAGREWFAIRVEEAAGVVANALWNLCAVKSNAGEGGCPT